MADLNKLQEIKWRHIIGIAVLSSPLLYAWAWVTSFIFITSCLLFRFNVNLLETAGPHGMFGVLSFAFLVGIYIASVSKTKFWIHTILAAFAYLFGLHLSASIARHINYFEKDWLHIYEMRFISWYYYLLVPLFIILGALSVGVTRGLRPKHVKK